MQKLETSEPLVTVLIPVFNAERHLRAAIESVQEQTYRNLEILAVNDGSRDGSAAILRALAAQDARIVVIEKENGGISSALNLGITAASGLYIARMDADDLMLPERIATQVRYLEANSDLGFCSCYLSMINADDIAFDAYCPEPTTRDALAEMLGRAEQITYTHPTVTYRTAVARELGGYRAEYEPCEDTEFFGRFITAGAPGLVIPETLMRYRVHAGSISGRKAAWQIEMAEFVRMNLYRRREGQTEHDPRAILAFVRALPHAERIAYRLRIKARVLHHTSKYDRASGRWLAALLRLGLAGLLQPQKALAQGLLFVKRGA